MSADPIYNVMFLCPGYSSRLILAAAILEAEDGINGKGEVA